MGPTNATRASALAAKPAGQRPTFIENGHDPDSTCDVRAIEMPSGAPTTRAGQTGGHGQQVLCIVAAIAQRGDHRVVAALLGQGRQPAVRKNQATG